MKHVNTMGIRPNNRIWIAAWVVGFLLLSLLSLRGGVVSAVALEQSARCGMTEHTHDSACYNAGRLTCVQPQHTHTENCYLVLLRDNNINTLLAQVDADSSNNLEAVITSTVTTATRLSTDTSPPPEPADTTPDVQAVLLNNTSVQSGTPTVPETPEPSELPAQLNVSALNETITENNVEPGLVLNENLYKASALAAGPGDLALPLDSGISTLSVGDSASTGNNSANFYVHLDGEWTCFGTLTFTTSGASWRTTARLTTGNVVNLINTSLGTSFGWYDLNLKWASSANPSSWNDVTVNNSNITFRNGSSDYFTSTNMARSAKYVFLVDDNAEPISFFTVKFTYANGTTSTQYIRSGTAIDLPNAPSGYVWTVGTAQYTSGQSVTITEATTFVAQSAVTYYDVTFRYPDGSTGTQSVQAGTQVTLPTGYLWTVNGVTYNGGDSITITAPTTFVGAQPTAGGVQVRYSVNFPTQAGPFSNTVTMPASPTLAGTTLTAVNDSVAADEGTSVRDISSREVTATTNHNAKFFYVFLFEGWTAENGMLVYPNSRLEWSSLQACDANGDGIVTLTGQWSHSRATFANFCVRYDSKTGQSDTSTTKYTPSLYATYVGGGGDLTLDGQTDAAAYEVDQQIRALYGNWSGDVWLYSFPSDEYIFEQLKSYTAKLQVEDEEVRAEDLHADMYAIRWYMIKEDGQDGWHIDGRLVKKKGQITVTKEFYGTADTVALAKSGFYITAQNAAQTKMYVLTLDQATANTQGAQYPNASVLTSSSGRWAIEGVELNEVWRIEEHPVPVAGNIYYAEYSAYDTDGTTSAIAEYGTAATLTGKTFALDQDPDQGMFINFSNYYYPNESILIKKEDADTGQPLGGAVFELWQYNSEHVLAQLKFSYDTDTGQYRYDNNGTVTRISTGAAGYSTISTTGFSYSHGSVVVKEVAPPTGYAVAPSITLTDNDGTVAITDMTLVDGSQVSKDQWSRYGEVYDDGSVLIVKDQTAATASLTVKKVWADNITDSSVTMVLQANGSTATNLFPGLSGIRGVLTLESGWQYTWSGLPTHANGTPVTWSVKEILVGDEPTTSDGVSFANWTVVYSQPTQSDPDGDGVVNRWTYTVTNSARRAQLYLMKTSAAGIPLGGAAFELTEVDRSGSPVSGTVVHSGTTGDDGLLRLDNLKYTVRYRLTETGPPTGYEAYTVPAYLTLAPDGTVTVESHSHVSAGTGAYMIQVVNHAPRPLPATGGSGPELCQALGILLMLGAAWVWNLPPNRKEGRWRSEQ